MTTPNERRLYQKRLPWRTHTAADLVALRRRMIGERLTLWRESYGLEMPQQLAERQVDSIIWKHLDSEQDSAMASFFEAAEEQHEASEEETEDHDDDDDD